VYKRNLSTWRILNRWRLPKAQGATTSGSVGVAPRRGSDVTTKTLGNDGCDSSE